MHIALVYGEGIKKRCLHCLEEVPDQEMTLHVQTHNLSDSLSERLVNTNSNEWYAKHFVGI